jgi:hypothetical protein
MSKPLDVQCDDPTQDITIPIPCPLAERVAAFAADNHTSVASVVIEALDYFLREQMPR